MEVDKILKKKKTTTLKSYFLRSNYLKYSQKYGIYKSEESFS